MKKPYAVMGARLALAVALLLLWELGANRLWDPYWISTPSAMWAYLLKSSASGQLWRDMGHTFSEAAIGYVIGASAGVATGFILGRWSTVAKVLDPFILAFYGVPRIALAPLFIVWFGIGPTSKIVLAATVVFFLTFFSTFTGVQSIDPELQELVRVMGAGEGKVLTKIVIPGTMPWVLAGLKMAIPQGLVGAIVGEFMASSKGLGFRVQLEANMFNTAGTMALIMILAVIVVGANDLLDRAEKKILRWRPVGKNTGDVA